jgi:hypothetical protein
MLETIPVLCYRICLLITRVDKSINSALRFFLVEETYNRNIDFKGKRVWSSKNDGFTDG